MCQNRISEQKSYKKFSTTHESAAHPDAVHHACDTCCCPVTNLSDLRYKGQTMLSKNLYANATHASYNILWRGPMLQGHHLPSRQFRQVGYWYKSEGSSGANFISPMYCSEMFQIEGHLCIPDRRVFTDTDMCSSTLMRTCHNH